MLVFFFWKNQSLAAATKQCVVAIIASNFTRGDFCLIIVVIGLCAPIPSCDWFTNTHTNAMRGCDHSKQFYSIRFLSNNCGHWFVGTDTKL